MRINLAKQWVFTAAVVAAVAAVAWPEPVRAQPGTATDGIEAPRWTVFADALGTRVDYPDNIFSVNAGPPPRGDGLILRSADDRARLMIYVEDNKERNTPASFVRSYLAAPVDQLDYNRVTDRFFAISGVTDHQIYYSRCNFPLGLRGQAHCIYLSYPKEEERQWDAIVTRISLSLRPSR